MGYSPCGHKESDTTEQLTLFLDHQCLSVCSVAGTVWVLGICQGRKQRKIPAFMELQGFTGGSDGKESVCNAGDLGLIPESGRSPGEGNGNPVQYSCLENPMDGGAWPTTVHGSQSWTRLSDFTFTFMELMF